MKKLIYKILVSTITIIFIFSLFINQNLGLRVEASSSENFGIHQVCTLKLAETSNTASNTSQEENSNQTEQNETTENTVLGNHSGECGDSCPVPNGGATTGYLSYRPEYGLCTEHGVCAADADRYLSGLEDAGHSQGKAAG